MRNYVQYAFVFAASALVSAPLIGQQTRSEQIDVGGYRLHFRLVEPLVVAPDAPTIVLEAGGGNDSRFWADLQPRLAQEFRTRVVAYDRAGWGESDLPDLPYDIRRDARDLRTALSRLGLHDRVLLIAHSYGALTAQVFAAMWPETVHGIVFMDPATTAAYPAVLRDYVDSITLPEPRNSVDRATVRLLGAYLETMVTAYRDAPLRQNTPIIVISASRGLFATDRHNQAFLLSHQLLAKSVEHGEWLLAEGAGHNIIPARTDLVLESIRKLLAVRQ